MAKIALVLGLIAFLICSIFMFQVNGSQSTKTGFKLFFNTAIKFETIVKFGIIISSFFLRFKHLIAISKAAVPLETVEAYFFYQI